MSPNPGSVDLLDDVLTDVSDAVTELASRPQGRFHLHTAAIEGTVIPPPTHLTYTNRQERNPSHAIYADLAETLASSIDPFVPLTLSSPGPSLIHPRKDAHRPRRHIPEDLEVFLPTSHKTKPLVRLKSPMRALGKEWYPSSSSWDTRDWLHASLSLDPDEEATRKLVYRDELRRVSLETGVQISWVPDERDENAVEVKLAMTINVYLDLEAIKTPLPDIGRELLGMIYHSLITSSTTRTPMTEQKARAAALRDFFACMRPAPPLRALDAHDLQPKDMVSRLLPFQRRTVASLLRREGATLGDVKPIAHDPPGFWEGHDMQGGKMAFRRLTGDLTPLQPVMVDRKGKRKANRGGALYGLQNADFDELSAMLDLSGVRGTMLCEEMGRSFCCPLRMQSTHFRPRKDRRGHRAGSTSSTPFVYPQTSEGEVHQLYEETSTQAKVADNRPHNATHHRGPHGAAMDR